jgi:rhodanese-related sulfurtransferase
MRHALLLCLSLLAGAAIAAEPPTPPAALAARIAAHDAPLVLDVRTPEEFATGHVPGAVLIPHDQLESRIGELGTPREVVVYCRSGRRSKLIEPVLEAHGFKVSQLEGSWLAWQAAGLPSEGDAPVVAPADPAVKP